MPSLEETVEEFLAQEHIAITGISRTKPNAANGVYQKLRDKGYQVYPVNPNAEEFQGDPCYPDLKSIPVQVGAVFIGNRAELAEAIVRECAELGIGRVWMHRSFKALGTSVSEPAVEFCKENNIAVIPGGCPMWFVEPVDFGHKMIRWINKMTGGTPQPA